MKVAIIGSRSFQDYNLLKETLEPYKSKITDIISGGAKGADGLGARWCKEFLKKDPIIFLPEWDNLSVDNLLIGHRNGNPDEPYNILAGFERNTKIIKNCKAVIAFWDGKSTGTKDSLDKAKKMKKPSKVIIYE